MQHRRRPGVLPVRQPAARAGGSRRPPTSLGLTPNAVTGISALLSFSAIAVLALVPPAWWIGLLVAVLLVLGYAFDSADGQVARLRGGGSSAGEWLDHVVDAVKIAALHLAVLVGAYRFFDLGSRGWLLIPIGFVLVANVTFFGMILNDLLRPGRPPRPAHRSCGRPRRPARRCWSFPPTTA